MLFALGKQLAKLTSDKILPARIGGEEFAIIVDGMPAEEVCNLAQSILENVRSILINHDYPLSVSIGVGMREKVKRRMRLLRRWMKRSTGRNITAVDASSGPHPEAAAIPAARCDNGGDIQKGSVRYSV